MEIDLFELWSQMNNLVRTVVILLTLEALACIAVVVDRGWMLWSAGRRSRRFAAEAGPKLLAGAHEEVARLAGRYPGVPLADYFRVGLEVFLARLRAGLGARDAARLTERALERKGEQISEGLNRGMNVLATTGSTAPFIGLLGTVLGILHAFSLMAQEGSGGMSTIGASIGEALIVTGYGLMVAIPAVIFFNLISARIAAYEAGLLNAGGELVDALEAGPVEAVEAEDAAEDAAEEAAEEGAEEAPRESQERELERASGSVPSAA